MLTDPLPFDLNGGWWGGANSSRVTKKHHTSHPLTSPTTDSSPCYAHVVHPNHPSLPTSQSTRPSSNPLRNLINRRVVRRRVIRRPLLQHHLNRPTPMKMRLPQPDLPPSVLRMLIRPPRLRSIRLDGSHDIFHPTQISPARLGRAGSTTTAATATATRRHENRLPSPREQDLAVRHARRDVAWCGRHGVRLESRVGAEEARVFLHGGGCAVRTAGGRCVGVGADPDGEGVAGGVVGPGVG